MTIKNFNLRGYPELSLCILNPKEIPRIIIGRSQRGQDSGKMQEENAERPGIWVFIQTTTAKEESVWCKNLGTLDSEGLQPSEEDLDDKF